MMGAQVLGEELEWSPQEVFQNLESFMEKRWREKAPILDGIQIQQEELCSSTYYNVGCLDLY